MTKANRFTLLVALLALALPFLTASSALAQIRLSDKDISQRMRNLDGDAKRFRSQFDAAISKSAIRKTAQEKDAKKLAETFEKQTKSMLDVFNKTKKADPSLQNCIDTALQIDKVLQSAQLDGNITSAWTNIKSQLGDLGTAFHLPGY